MKKILTLSLATILAFGFTACGTDSEETATPMASAAPTASVAPASAAPASKAPTAAPTAMYKDGTYTSTPAEFDEDGWKDYVTITVQGGKITTCVWNSTNKEGGDDKKTVSEKGEYGMVEKGGATMEWYEQAALMEAALVESQDISTIVVDSDGKTDAVSGVTMGVDSFVKLATDCVTQAKI